MSLDVDQEILQDFIIESGEILEQLSEQLVDLESSPDDADLLNAIFRGFHTIKGGAGFLQLAPLVECCHSAENVFDTLRKGDRALTHELMDVILSALDTINEMFASVRAGEMPDEADESLIKVLTIYAQPEGADANPSDAGASKDTSAIQVSDAVSQNTISEEQIEQFAEDEFLPSGETLTDVEYEKLLELISPRGASNVKASVTSNAQTSESNNSQADAAPNPEEVEQAVAEFLSSSTEEITEEEFESLLDKIHGKGRGPSAHHDELDSPDAEFEQMLEKLPGGESAKSTSVATTSNSKETMPVPTAKKAVAKQQATGDTTVRVDTSRLDSIMNLVGELVLVRNRLVRLGVAHADGEMAKAIANLDVVTGDLQTSVMKTRMQPIKRVFGRFPRIIRDLSRNMNKEILLEMHGEDTDLDKNLVEALADPMVHLVRNSVDHGIEMPDVRIAAGKDKQGKITLSAEQEGDHILLTISDDGAGMDPEKLRNKAVEKGLLDKDAAKRLSDTEAYNLIFIAGLTTKEQASEVSGRGVGMDVVKTKIAQLNGTINVWSELGAGTKIIIKVPLTLAIMPTLMIMLQEQIFALPLVSVNEIFQLDVSKANIVDGQECIIIRNKALPIFYLRNWLADKRTRKPIEREELVDAQVVIVSVGNQRVGFVVDRLMGQEEVVIKPLGEMLHNTPGVSGSTITGDGRIALILDIPDLLKHYAASSKKSIY